MYSRVIITITLIFLCLTFSFGLNHKKIRIAVNYTFIYHIPLTRSYQEAAEILKSLDVDFLARAYNDNSGPMLETRDFREGREEFERCGVPNPARASSSYLRARRTWQDFREIVSSVKAQNPDVIFEVCLHPQYVPKITWDPITHRCMKTNKWALDFSKWGLINPKTGKLFDLESSQSFMNEFTGGAPGEREYYWYLDLTNSKVREYLLKKVERYIDEGADAIGFDILFGQLNATLLILSWMKRNGFYNGNVYTHPAVKDNLKAIRELVNGVRQLGIRRNRKILVGTWAYLLLYPDELNIPKFDYIYITPTADEVRSLSFDSERWIKTVKGARGKLGENVLIMSFMDNGGLDKYPMHIFSQVLSHNQQVEFLKRWDNFTRSLGIIPVYPVQDGVMGQHVWRLSYGKYNKFDALAPEFDLISTVRELALNAVK